MYITYLQINNEKKKQRKPINKQQFSTFIHSLQRHHSPHHYPYLQATTSYSLNLIAEFHHLVTK